MRHNRSQAGHLPVRDSEAEINVGMTQDDATARKRRILRSIPGIASVTAAAIRIECPEVGTLTAGQIVSPSGRAPMTRRSGK